MEHVRVSIPQLPDLDQRIEVLEDQAGELRNERQELINAEARKVAVLPIGHEFKIHDRTYRVTKITGEHYGDSIDKGPPFIYVRYYGTVLFKSGKVGPEKRLYIPEGR